MQSTITKCNFKLSLVALAAFSSNPAFAQEQQGTHERSQTRFSVGVAVISSTEAYLGQETDTLVVPAISYETENWYFRGIELGYRPEILRENGLVVFATYSNASFDPDDNSNAQLRALDERPFRIDSGLRYEQDWMLGKFSAETAINLRDFDTGARVSLQNAYPLSDKPYIFQLSPYIGVNYLSKDYANYTYGVDTQDTEISGLNTYQLGSTYTVEYGLSGYFRVNRHWTLAANIKLEHLSQDIKNSPLVSDSTNQSAFIFVTYSF
ncbi:MULTISPECIES: MipA/OmpV family protein [Gammaproteobacteria]|uniref:MipA/OmpV family protein n=1 Tax=Gammaproteobacteria TaxID=1236 RepID=UPI000DD0DFB8|nr:MULTISPECIES: MipA/OmpV family protein [Gammaproteobacteria]RTE87226.1 MipA/OmpV family protein [Aliidiomarina sp. B3213]TCZ92986.1 MipA/OmpV family protein [Lysobacter sp. N42]